MTPLLNESFQSSVLMEIPSKNLYLPADVRLNILQA